jgi:GNAT superfamily N-acetyltransferase
MADVTGRPIDQDDVDGVVGLMRSIGVHFAGSKADAVLRAIARDGVQRPHFVTVFVTEHEQTLGGVVIAFTRRAHYWREFPARHPIAAARMAAHRLVRQVWRTRARVGRSAPVAKPIDPAAQQMWMDDRADIAKVMYVGVDPRFRGAGLGYGLYRSFFRYLAGRGYRFCDAQVSEGNTAAIALHRRFSFQFVDVPSGYFARLDLRQAP